MTEAERKAVQHIGMLAINAKRDLGANASQGTKARPTVKQLNQTLDRLAAIIEAAENILLAPV